MMINSFQINAALQLVPVAAEKAVEMSQSTEARIWLDLQALEPDELEVWLDRLEVSGLSRQICLEARDRPGFYPLKNEILLVVPVLADADAPFESDHVLFLCRENLMLTLRRESVMSPQRFDAIKASESWLPERSIAALVSAVLISMSLECLRLAADLRSSILTLEERMDRDPDTVEVEEILDIRSDLLALRAVVSDRLPPLRALGGTDKPFFKLEDSQEYMNCALVNLDAAGSIRSVSCMKISSLA